MNNKILIVLGGGALLLFAWKKQSSGTKTKLGIPAPSNQPGARARVDNQSQPWYTGPLGWAKSKADTYAHNPQLVQSDLTSVVHSASDVWGTLSGFASGGQGTADHVDAIPSTNSMDASIMADANNEVLPADTEFQSNNIGAITGSDMQTMDDPANTIVAQNSGDSSAYIDSSNTDSGMGSDNMLSA